MKIFNRKLIFSPFKINNFNLFNKFNKNNFTEAKTNSKINKTELTNEQRLTLEQHTEGFKKLVDFMIKREIYTWDDYLQQIIFTNEKDRNVWKRIRQSKDVEKAEIEDTNKLVACLFPDEKSSDVFTLKDIQNISKIADINERFIIMAINNFRFHFGIHSYFREKYLKGDILPTNLNELNEMMERDNPKFRMDSREKMIEEIRQRLGYSQEHIKRNEQNNYMRRSRKLKKTHKF